MSGYNIAEIQYRIYKEVIAQGRTLTASGYLDQAVPGVLLTQLSFNDPERVGVVPTIKGLIVEGFPQKSVLNFTAAFTAPLREEKYVKRFFRDITDVISPNVKTYWRLNMEGSKTEIPVECVIKSMNTNVDSRSETVVFNVNGELFKEMPWMGTFEIKRY